MAEFYECQCFFIVFLTHRKLSQSATPHTINRLFGNLFRPAVKLTDCGILCSAPKLLVILKQTFDYVIFSVHLKTHSTVSMVIASEATAVCCSDVETKT